MDPPSREDTREDKRAVSQQRDTGISGHFEDPVTPELPPPGQGKLRRENYRLRADLWRYQPKARARKCGRCRIASDVVLVLEEREHWTGPKGFLTGLATCSSVWACPVCSLAICQRRREIVTKVIAQATSRGMGVALITLTMRHREWMPLAELVDGLKRADRSAWAGRWVQEWREKWGFVGWMTTPEVTHGKSGWHPHLHKVAIFKCPLSDAELREMWGEISERWRKYLVRKLGPENEPSADYGVDVARADNNVGGYLCKLGLEITSPSTKKGSDHNRGPWQIACDLVESDSPRDAELWREYVEALHGKSQLSWSKGQYDLKKLFGVEDCDDEAAADEGPKERVFCARLPEVVWDACNAADKYAGLHIIEAGERGGADAVDALVRDCLKRQDGKAFLCLEDRPKGWGFRRPPPSTRDGPLN